MPSNSAEYQRKYRARRAGKPIETGATGLASNGTIEGPTTSDNARQRVRIRDLEAEIEALRGEVVYLKGELAKRPAAVVFSDDDLTPADVARITGFNTRPFTPVPKGKKK